ncbi:hypothetical protein Tco_1333484, partial [Tanacetum coccineum]
FPGRVLVPPGSVVVPPGSVVVPTGSVVVPIGSVVVPTGSILVSPDSVITTGSILVSPGSVITTGSILVSPASVITTVLSETRNSTEMRGEKALASDLMQCINYQKARFCPPPYDPLSLAFRLKEPRGEVKRPFPNDYHVSAEGRKGLESAANTILKS